MSPQSAPIEEFTGKVYFFNRISCTHRGRVRRFIEIVFRLGILCPESDLTIGLKYSFSVENLNLPLLRWVISQFVLVKHPKPIKRAKSDDRSLPLDDGVYLSDVSPQDKPWDVHRANTDIVSDMYESIDESRYAERARECARQLWFALRELDDGKRALKLFRAKFCRLRHCPVCQWRRSKMWLARFFNILPKLFEIYPNHRFIFLTLTVRNCHVDDLRKTLAWMNKAWTLLTKRKQFPVIGWVKSVEVTRGADGSAHPHFHVLCMVKPSYFKSRDYLSHEKWVELWRSCLRVDYDPSIRAKAIKTEEIEKALCETLKYSVKESDIIANAEWLRSLTIQLHKTRAVAVGGVLRELLSDDEPEDLINADLEDNNISENDPKFAFGWREKVKRYRSE